MKHLLKLADLSGEEILSVLNLADQLKYELKHGISHKRLEGKTLGMIFTKASTRTRVSFEVGRLGAVFKRQRPSDRTRRAYSGYRARSFALSRRNNDKDVQAK